MQFILTDNETNSNKAIWHLHQMAILYIFAFDFSVTPLTSYTLHHFLKADTDSTDSY